MFRKEKKIQVSEEKFSECEEGEKCLSIEFRVFEKKRSERKKSLERRFLGGDFAKFVFAGWAPCCETWLKLKVNLRVLGG